MKTQHIYGAVLALVLVSCGDGLNFFTASVDPPNSPYSQLLSGNDVFETIYGTFNSTGLVLLGGALLLSSGKIDLLFSVFHTSRKLCKIFHHF